MINLAAQPPDRRPPTYFEISSFAPQVPANRHYYQKAIMKKFNFVLDIEAARNFPSNVDVSYSWGRPDFKNSQYIHRSGVVLAQITDEGNFLLLANRLYNNRTAAARESDKYVRMDHGDRAEGTRMGPVAHLPAERTTPVSSPLLRPTLANIQSPVLKAASDVLGPSSLANSKLATVTTPQSIKNDLEAFCLDAAELESFYSEVYDKALPPSATPPPSQMRSPTVTALGDVPTLGLPPGLFARDPSPSPMRLSGVSGVGSPMLASGRRQSVQLSALSFFQGGSAEAAPRRGSSSSDKE
jgi:hypothetical protein